MVNISIRMVGYVQALTSVQAVGEAGRAVNGSLATFLSRKAYARPIEKNEFLSGPRKGKIARRAGPAKMFEKGVAEAAAAAPGILGPAIPKGNASIGQAKRKIRDFGIERIRAYTPVRSGKLRDSVGVIERPGIGGQ